MIKKILGIKKKDKELLRKNRAEVAKAIEILFTKDYISQKQLYLQNFLRGIFFGAGGVIGATVLVAIIVWSLSLFDETPLIGPLVDNVRTTIEDRN